MPLSFQSPAGLLVTLVAIAPLAALVVHERRSTRLREALGLAGPGHARTIASAGVVAASFVLLGLAAARPVLRVPTDNFFAPSLRKRLVVLVSDGESVPFAASGIASVFRSHGVGLIVVRVGGAADRIFDARGRDIGYRPVREAFASTDRLA